MKIYVMIAMLLAGVCAVSEAAPKKKHAGGLGKVLYIGDSITHGFRAPSYRWQMHKILTDNDIEYEEIGIEKGSHSNGVAEGTTYIGNAFKNTHAAMSGQRAYETSGRDHQKSDRLDKTDIYDWLEIEGKADSDKRKLNAKPDTAFIMLGTNDLLSDTEDDVAKKIGPVQKNLLNKKEGDMHMIVNALRTANSKMKVYVLSVPTWGQMAKHTKPADYEAVVKGYNKKLRGAFKKEFIDINPALVDIANGEKLCGVKSFFAKDQLHPSPQGDLLIAGLVARGIGIAGRTAGLTRKAAADFALSAQQLLSAATVKEGVSPAEKVGVAIESGKALETGWGEGADVLQGFSVELSTALGNGARGGWEKAPLLKLTLGNGVHAGQLNIYEGYIMWGEQPLYSLDMSKNHDAVRVAWIAGSEALNIKKGFYVWLGDMLIGEGLADVGGKMSGIKLENPSAAVVTLSSLAATTAPYAPATKLKVGSNPASVQYDEESAAPADKAKPADEKPAEAK